METNNDIEFLHEILTGFEDLLNHRGKTEECVFLKTLLKIDSPETIVLGSESFFDNVKESGKKVYDILVTALKAIADFFLGAKKSIKEKFSLGENKLKEAEKDISQNEKDKEVPGEVVEGFDKKMETSYPDNNGIFKGKLTVDSTLKAFNNAYKFINTKINALKDTELLNKAKEKTNDLNNKLNSIGSDDGNAEANKAKKDEVNQATKDAKESSKELNEVKSELNKLNNVLTFLSSGVEKIKNLAKSKSSDESDDNKS